MKSKNTTGFTLVELMVVVVIVAVLATIGIPKYRKTVGEATLRDLRSQLISLHAANEIYRAQDGNEYLPGTNLNLIAINAGLNTNIITSDTTIAFDYDRTAELAYTCNATSVYGTVTISSVPISTTNPGCTAAIGFTCPW